MVALRRIYESENTRKSNLEYIIEKTTVFSPKHVLNVYHSDYNNEREDRNDFRQNRKIF